MHRVVRINGRLSAGLVGVAVVVLAAVSCSEGGEVASVPGSDRTSTSASTAGPPTTGAPSGARIAPGDHDLRLTFDGEERAYTLHVPDDLGDGRVPLLLSLHGGGMGRASAALVGFDHVADREGFLVAYPNALEQNWNDGRDTTFSPEHTAGVDDVGYLAAVIDEIDALAHVDRGRIWVQGMSNGGMMTHRLACERPDLVAAAAMVIANAPSSMVDCSGPVPVVIMNGTEDPLMPWTGGQVVGDRGEVLSAPATARTWASVNGCADAALGEVGPLPEIEEVVPLDPAEPTRVVHQVWPCPDAPVELYEIVGGGHTVPGGGQYLPVEIIGTVSRQLDGVETIYAFLSSQPPR